MADRSRPTPSPPPGVCLHHGGFYERIRDLEEKASAAVDERRDIVRQVTDIKVSLAKWMGGLAVLLVVVNIATAVLLKVLS